MENNYSLADLASAVGNNGFGNDGIWIFALLILMFGGGGFYGSRGEAYATNGDVQRAFDTNTIEQGIRGLANGLADVGYAIDNKIDGAKDFLAAGIGGTKDAVNAEGRAMQMQLADYHCKEQANVDALRFDMANYHADTNAVTVAQSQKILDALAQNKIDELQNKVNQLELQTAMCGVPKINPYMYGISPAYAGCGCCSGNI